MILVQKITIQEFRGIRNLTLDFKGSNFAICGPNGTGKSGVVDALEFVLTGNISRLSGRGMGGVTLKEHAPHVDSRDDPEKARVSVVLQIPSLGNQQVTIERNVKSANVLKVTPSTPDVLGILKQLEDHPEFVLSRRELIAYILAQPGERSEEIQALLRLDQVGELRSVLKKISNTCNSEEITLKKVRVKATENLVQALDIPDFSSEKLLAATNMRRAVLGLGHIETLTSTTSLRDGLETGGKPDSASSINKSQAVIDFKKVRELFMQLSAADTEKERSDIYTQLEVLNADPSVAENVSREKFLRNAISLITENTCPVCDTEWDINTLRGIVEAKLKKYEEIARIRTALEQRLALVIDLMEGLHDVLASIEKYSKIIAIEQVAVLSEYRSSIVQKTKSLKNFFPLTETLNALEKFTVVSLDVVGAVDIIERAIQVIPEPTQQEAARDYLILCQDRLETYREAARIAKRAKERAELAKSIYDTYTAASTQMLEGVYKQVEEEFGDLYRYINKDDEGDFTAHLIPSMGKLGFEVEFYGRGQFPPGAYHSEGHQDGMGLCLYLALMQRLQGDRFTFAVLDDILMSVDTGHRREVCNLLKERFPNTQFVLTTHDEVWLKHMMSAGLIGQNNSVRFSNWTPDHGPTEWSSRDIWTEIDLALKQNDVRAAAGILRHYLEHIFKEVCGNLRAPVEFKGDGRYDLGDVLNPAVRCLRDIFLDGKKAAESWGKTADAELADVYEKKLAESLRISNADQWQINPAVHFNEWANLTRDDFTPVVAAYHELVNKFYCPNADCAGLLYLVTTSSKKPDAIRCRCGSININLRKKNS